ncbi:Rab-GTPase-TBC domain-containing protein [Chloropicon primus]|uniref:Rab-GTPase-TBC domain-containing protein n=2 Tax=Chloropicon primus TaxID=1764295 RepID=A0A5B8N292_9CHLO|nr:Rab-GTPase-TBC domain-containing protein [Chloropicon primus]UPR05180.1 Rab-GTPase-TBC domain-containing protein [Chloropicon primus]|eukprot:QDZ25980.1 Rab-GTPase-TBC domain-containing protein [Chloropicon primus]
MASEAEGGDHEFEDLDGFETWRGGRVAADEGGEGEDTVDDLKELKPQRVRREREASLSARDLHGFELRKEQVETYKRFEPVLKEEERERVSRWVRFAEEYAPKDAGSTSASNGDDEGLGSSALDMEKLIASVNFVLKSSATIRERERERQAEGNGGAENGSGEGDGLAEVVDVAIRELRMLVQSGVPNQARGVLWQVFLQVEERQSEQEQRSGDELGGFSWGSLEAYKYLCSDEEFEKKDGEDPSLPYLKVINKDIPRTLPAHKQAREFGESGSLMRVLKAYCRHHPDVGYCQGMNFVAGLFLIILTDANEGGEAQPREEDDLLLESHSYWCFDSLCSRVLARYYTEDMVELQVDQLVMQQLLEEKFPTVATQMDNLGVSLACVSSSWLLCGFANALPWTTLLRTWDVLLFPDMEEEDSALVQSSLLFKFTLALVDIHSRSLIQCKDPTQLIVLLQSMAVQSFDSSQLVTIACQGFSDVSQNKLEPYRDLYRPIVTTTFGNKRVPDPVSSYTGGAVDPALETPEAAKVRDRLGLRSLDNGTSSHAEMEGEDGIVDMGGISDRSSLSSARSNASGSASARHLRRRFLGSHGSFGLLSPFSRHNSVRRNVSTGMIPHGGSGTARNGDPALQQDSMNEQIMQLTSVRYYLEKQVVDLIGIVARMNKDLREKDQLQMEQAKALEVVEKQNLKLLGSVDALEKELNQKLEDLKTKDDLVYMLQEKIGKQLAEIGRLKNSSGSPKAKLAQQFSKLNMFKRKTGDESPGNAATTTTATTTREGTDTTNHP